LAAAPAGIMLNEGICRNYYKNRKNIAAQEAVTVLFEGDDAVENFKGSAALLQVSATDFINDSGLQHEIFGPASMIIKCKNETDLQEAIHSLQGQLTGTVFATNEDIKNFADCINELSDKVGRVVYNNVPTGVEVCHAMVHGGPFPATTDARSTSVGADAIKRFVRPICLQDCPQEFLPDALKNENPLHIMRKVNGVFTNESI
jgi:alpha-ketoglutaric semialdehyde dehydrogenase